MKKPIKLGIVGCGAIGRQVALFLDQKLAREVTIAYLYDTKPHNPNLLKLDLKHSRPVITNDLDTLVENSSLILETASWKAVAPLIKKALAYEKDLIILSVGGLIGIEPLLKKVQAGPIKLFVPSGAICGIDGILASFKGTIKKCTLTTSKPPSGLANVQYLKDMGIDVTRIKKKKVVFQGTAKQAFKRFPQNINVASTLLLASRFKGFKVCIKVDPKLKTNMHEIALESGIGRINIRVENLPSKDNPKTSTLAIASTQALFRKLCSQIKIGT
ncbi:aspartate dehydrogenase domain-containing protein [Candidatus Omnitrophota bacterium]